MICFRSFNIFFEDSAVTIEVGILIWILLVFGELLERFEFIAGIGLCYIGPHAFMHLELS